MFLYGGQFGFYGQLSLRISIGKEKNFILYIHLGGRHVPVDIRLQKFNQRVIPRVKSNYTTGWNKLNQFPQLHIFNWLKMSQVPGAWLISVNSLVLFFIIFSSCIIFPNLFNVKTALFPKEGTGSSLFYSEEVQGSVVLQDYSVSCLFEFVDIQKH